MVDEIGQTPLHYAAQFGPVAIVRDLLRLGANKEMRDKHGMTPADLATDEAIINLLY